MLIRPAAVAPGTCCHANQVFSPEDADRELPGTWDSVRCLINNNNKAKKPECRAEL